MFARCFECACVCVFGLELREDFETELEEMKCFARCRDDYNWRKLTVFVQLWPTFGHASNVGVSKHKLKNLRIQTAEYFEKIRQ